MIINQDGTGTCPHCHRDIHFLKKHFDQIAIPFVTLTTNHGDIQLEAHACPTCKATTLFCNAPQFKGTIHPFGTSRLPLGPEVPEDEIVKDYKEACRVAHLSSNASGALARRALSRMLVKCYGAKEADDLPNQIEHSSTNIPNPKLVEDLHYVRQVGKFAAHAKENRRTSEIIDVTPDEVEATLTIVEELLDDYYVQPKRRDERWSKLKSKVEATKKPRP